MRLLTTFVLCGYLMEQTAATPKFGAASIKPVPEGGSRPRLVDSPSGVEYPSIWMFDLVRRAWGLRAAGGLGFGRSPKGGERVSGNVGLDLLAQAIAPAMGRPVITQTGLTGVYEILVYSEPDNSGSGDPTL